MNSEQKLFEKIATQVYHIRVQILVGKCPLCNTVILTLQVISTKMGWTTLQDTCIKAHTQFCSKSTTVDFGEQLEPFSYPSFRLD